MLLRTMKLLFSYEQVSQNFSFFLAVFEAFPVFSCSQLSPLSFLALTHPLQPTANQNDIDDSELAGVCSICGNTSCGKYYMLTYCFILSGRYFQLLSCPLMIAF